MEMVRRDGLVFGAHLVQGIPLTASRHRFLQAWESPQDLPPLGHQRRGLIGPYLDVKRHGMFLAHLVEHGHTVSNGHDKPVTFP